MRLVRHGQAYATSKVFETPRVSFVDKVLYINTAPLFRPHEVNVPKRNGNRDTIQETILRCD